MTRSIQFILLCAIIALTYSFTIPWGQTGHRTTGAIADKYLSAKARLQVQNLLEGRSLAWVSTYADEIKSDSRYRAYGPWHYVNFPFDSDYNSHPKSDKGDIVQAIETCKKILLDTSSSKADKVFHLKLLVHFIGDLHQPLHIGKAEDRGGNDFKVRWFNKPTNLHSVWDTKMIESHGMSYTELAMNAPWLSAAEISDIQAGTILDWLAESRALCLDVYKHTAPNTNLSYAYSYKYFNTVHQQLQKGGIRLAAVLNEIFD